jgi:uncharacterized protein YecT (DUF1311 family)
MRRRTTVLFRFILLALLLSAHGARAASSSATVLPYPNTAGFGVSFTTSEEWHRQCMRVAHLPAPPATTAKTPVAPCDATDLYYQKRDQKRTSSAEWREVQACARASADNAVLMMLYANGYGQPRDADRALQHACRLDSAKAEMEGRVSYLASSALNTDGQPFDLCDHVTSDHMRSVCTALRDARVERAYKARLDRFAQDLAPSARAAFAQLRKAADTFVRLSASEVNQGSAMGAAFAVDHAARRRDEFLQAVLDVANGKVPPASIDEFVQLDAQLNTLYRRLMASAPGGPGARVGRAGIAREDVRTTERAWLAYRDAWLPFLAAKGVKLNPVALNAMLTRQRIAQLARL